MKRKLKLVVINKMRTNKRKTNRFRLRPGKINRETGGMRDRRGM